MKWTRVAALGAAAVGAVAAHDLTQKKHAILRNFPVIGHLRFLLERFGPELRQYIVTSNDEERPVQPRPAALGLRLVEAGEQLLRLRHRQRRRERRRATSSSSTAPSPGPGAADRPRTPTRSRRSRRPRCSAGRAAGGTRSARLGGQHLRHELRRRCPATRSRRSTGGRRWPAASQNTGEGALSPYHRSGGDLVFQIGTAYFGCRDEHGALRPGPAQRPRRVGAGQGDRDQALAGRQAGAGRHAAGAPR